MISDRYEKMGISSTDVSMLNVLFSMDMLPRDSRISPIVGRVIVLSYPETIQLTSFPTDVS